MSGSTKPPYQPSWLNRLIQRIETSRGPAWPYYLAWVFFLGVLINVASWLADNGTLGAVDVQASLFSVYPVYFVALMHYLDRHARSALEMFRPLLEAGDAEIARMEYELTTVPATGGWIAIAVAVPLALVVILGGDVSSVSGPGDILVTVLAILITAFTLACFSILAYHTMRQLRMVSQIHAVASGINLLHARPAYAFSRLTARTGIGLVFFVYFVLLQDPPDPSESTTYLLLGAIVTVAATAFVLPLVGMHRRLSEEKSRWETEVNSTVEATYRELQERVRSRTYAGIDDLNKVLLTLINFRGLVARLATWPWQAETLRGFLTALLLPVLIWAITHALDRIINF